MPQNNQMPGRNFRPDASIRHFLLTATFLAATFTQMPVATAQSADAAPQSAPATTAPATDASATHHRHYRHRWYRKHSAAAPTPAPAPAAVANAAPATLPADATPPAFLKPAAIKPVPAMFVVPQSQAPAAQEPAGAAPGLTPMGAIRAGNADGTIPAWTGGLAFAPTDKPIHSRPDPFASERPLFSITAQNVDRYAGKLSAGTIAMIKTIRGFHVDVYPTHRSFAAPQYIYDNAVANVARTKLVDGGEGVAGAMISVPFPVPHNGSEAIWNQILRWRGTQIVRTVSNVISTPTGDYSLQRWHEDIMFPYNTPGMANPKQFDSLFRQEILAPPRDAGSLTLVINHVNPSAQPREAWSYNTGERRVRRAPEIDYDTPLTDTDGLETVDDYDLFNGALDRFDWKLVGRREIYVPYNTYKLQDPTLHYADLIGPDAVKPEYIRFELHRVWQVEATLKPAFGHIYTRRTLYLDEDSWTALLSDRYDGRGNLWRTAMAFPIEETDVPVMIPDGYEYVDLYQHRYLMQGLHNEEALAPVNNATTLTFADFTADALRRMGRR